MPFFPLRLEEKRIGHLYIQVSVLVVIPQVHGSKNFGSQFLNYSCAVSCNWYMFDETATRVLLYFLIHHCISCLIYFVFYVISSQYMPSDIVYGFSFLYCDSYKVLPLQCNEKFIVEMLILLVVLRFSYYHDRACMFYPDRQIFLLYVTGWTEMS